MFTVRHALRIVPAAFLLVGCGGADLVLPGDGEAAVIRILQGDAQSGQDLGIDGPPGSYAIQFTADGFTAMTSDSIELR